MSPIVSTIEIDRPPEEVFAYATDPTRFAEWQHDVVRAQLVEGGPTAVGSRFTTTRRLGGAERTMTQEITQLDHPRSWAAQGRRPVAGRLHPRLPRARAGRPAHAGHPADGRQAGAGELPAPEGAAGAGRLTGRGSPATR